MIWQQVAAFLLPACIAAAPKAPATDTTALAARWQPLARDVFAELIQIDTTRAKGATPAAQAIARRLRDAGYDEPDLVVDGPLPHKQNLVVRLRGAGRAEPVLFIAHLDVVPANREDWSVDPFSFTEADGFFYGRGAQDMKDNVAALVVTLVRLRQERYVPDRDVVVAFTDDEEVGGPENGVSWLLAHRPELVKARFAINPDAGGGEARQRRRALLTVQTAEKVFVSFKLEATDRGGHSSLPHAGNPIYRVGAALGRIAAFEFPVHLSETTRGYFAAMATQESGALARDFAALGREPADVAAAARVSKASDTYAAAMHTTCVATEIAGGHAPNALPQMARATVNCRVLPDESPDDVQEKLRSLVADPSVTLTRVSNVTPAPPSPLAPAVVEPVTRVMKELFPGVRLAPVLDNSASDSKHLRRAGVPTYGVSGMFLDVDDMRMHGRDERIAIRDYYDGVEFTYRFMKEVTGGGGAAGRASPVGKSP